MRVWEHVISDVTILWREAKEGKIEEYWISHWRRNFYTDFSSPISSVGLPEIFLMSPGTTLLCCFSVLVALCSGLDFKEGGKCEISLYVYGLRNAGVFI